MNFSEFNKRLQDHVAKMTKGVKFLFEVDINKDIFWDLYLDSFPEGTNEIFLERREYDCNCCRGFVRSFGNVVSIVDNNVVTIWDFDAGDEKYQAVVDAMAREVRLRAVTNVFLPESRKFGTFESIELVSGKQPIVWSHFFVNVPKSIAVFNSDDIGTKRGKMRDLRNVLKRSLEEISTDAVETTLGLISQRSLYKGEEWGENLKQLLSMQMEYHKISYQEQKENYCWAKSVDVHPAVGGIKNSSIGVLLMDISSGMDLDTAVRRYEKVVAPSNYKRPKAIFTPRMVADAQKKVQELGLSLGRRYAVAGDVTVNNVLFANSDTLKQMGGDVFDELARGASAGRSFGKTEEIGVEKFISDVLPGVTDIEVLLENQHMSNMVSLIAPTENDAEKLFKWDNNFSWAYKGNITDSMKERVKSAGGNVDGVLRFSIQWNDENDNPDDLDAHCIEPNGNRIYFQNQKRVHPSTGVLDVDVRVPDGVAVENITWSNINRMRKGKYLFIVNNYEARGAKSGFTAEIEFNGSVYQFAYNQPLRNKEDVAVAEVDFDGNEFTMKERIPSNMATRDVWGLKTGQFHPVSMCMYSPNYWDDQHGVGHRHYLFMLKGCRNDESPNGFFNEFLREDLSKHKRVFEALGGKMRVEDAERQLSGVGFSATKRASIICKVQGSFNRTLKVLF